MKKKYTVCIILSLVLMFSFSAFAVKPSDNKVNASKPVTADRTEVLKSRFLNMLNHNFAYGEALDYNEELVNCAALACLDMRDGDFIAERYIKEYVFNMYGVDIEDFSGINAQFPKKEGFVYIVPRGFSVYKHSGAVISFNEDGTCTVTTVVTVNAHDGEALTGTAVTLFAKNGNSHFRYNIISSNLYFDAEAV